MPTHAEIDEVRSAVRNQDLLSKSESDLTRMSAVMAAWVLHTCTSPHEAQVCLTALQNQLEHIRTDRMAKQGESLAAQVENLTSVAAVQKESAQVLNGQTEKLIDETVALNRYAKEQLALGYRLDKLTWRIAALTVALVFLTIALLIYTVALYKDAKTDKEPKPAPTPSQLTNFYQNR